MKLFKVQTAQNILENFSHAKEKKYAKTSYSSNGLICFKTRGSLFLKNCTKLQFINMNLLESFFKVKVTKI